MNTIRKFVMVFFLMFIPLISSAGEDTTKAVERTTKESATVKFGMQVVMTAAPGKGNDLAQIMLAASKLLEKLEGCQMYVVQLSRSEEDTVLITEVWESQEDHKASLSVPDIRALIGKARPLIINMTHHSATPLGGVGI